MDAISSLDRTALGLGVQIGVACKPKKHQSVAKVKTADTAENCGEDAYFLSARERVIDKRYISFGVAGSVAGWDQYGINPSAFSNALCAAARHEFVKAVDPHPVDIMKRGYQNVLNDGDDNAGGSSATFLVLDRFTGRLDSANLGDSGYLIIRNGKVIFRSEVQTFDFNGPLQLCMAPSWIQGPAKKLLQRHDTDDSILAAHEVRPGDVIIVGSDGLFDNLFNHEILYQSTLFLGRFYKLYPAYHDALLAFWADDGRSGAVHQHPMIDEASLNDLHTAMVDLSYALTSLAKTLSFDMTSISPLAKLAHELGYKYNGPKEDDITVAAVYVHAAPSTTKEISAHDRVPLSSPSSSDENSRHSIIQRHAPLGVHIGVSCKPKDQWSVHVVNRSQTVENCGDDAYFFSTDKRTVDDNENQRYVSLGVAGGVGGWAKYGVNPQQFPKALCAGARRAFLDAAERPHPIDLLRHGYHHVVQGKDAHAGGSTATFIVLDRVTGRLEGASLGTSGYVILRKGKVIFRSEMQTVVVNAPFQLSLYPSWMNQDHVGGEDMFSTDDAVVTSHMVQSGDVVILGSDGLFDNLYESDIVSISALIMAKGNTSHNDSRVAPPGRPRHDHDYPAMNGSVAASFEDRHTAMEHLSYYLTWIANTYVTDKTKVSPYGHAVAMEAGHRYYGGRVDDMTTVAFYIS